MNTHQIFDVLDEVAVDHPYFGNAKVAAAVVHRGRIVSVGVNREKTHPVQAKFGGWGHTHAEVDAVLRAERQGIDVSGMEVYVLRIKKDGPRGPWVRGNARPCPACSRFLADRSVARAHWTCDDGTEAGLPETWTQAGSASTASCHA